MKLKSRSLRANLLLYFLLFSTLILAFLYFFQILFLNTYYKINRINTVSQVLSSSEKRITKKDYSAYLDELSYNNEVCIQVIDDDDIVYSSNFYRHCANKNNKDFEDIIEEFIDSDKEVLNLEFNNTDFNNKFLVYGKKINDHRYIFINTNLEPMDKSIDLLKSQFIYVAITILVLSFVISYYFSKRISDPIAKITSEAKNLGQKSSEVNFESDTDVYELQELSKTLNAAAKELSKTEELRREFLANVSHDLKTPLTMIEAYAASARDLNFNNKDKRERDLNIIIDEAERLNMLVNDILLLSKMENKTNELKIEKINITEFITTILERFAIYKNDGYTFVFDEKKDYFIEADKQGIERVIYNLVNNAINYTGSDKKVSISFEKEKDYLKIKVSDTGKGIENKDKKLVWNKYFRINKRHRREVVGTGLGLSIVKEILEEHKFEYGIDSKINHGTTFWFKCKIKR